MSISEGPAAPPIRSPRRRALLATAVTVLTLVTAVAVYAVLVLLSV